MRARDAALLLVLAACCCRNTSSDGGALAAAAELQIVAHQDDDLLFMQPDLGDALARRAGVVTVYVTAGNGRRGVELADKRNAGAREAYAALAGADPKAWSCGWISIAGRAAEHCRLEAARVSLVFLGYPDGGKQGEARDSLLHLWEGAIDRADTVARRIATYDRQGLVDALAEVIDTVKPRLVRTLDVAATHGRDHSDHLLVGAAALLAAAAARHDAELVSYRGYSIDAEPANAEPALFERSAAALRRYAACADGCAPCGEACAKLGAQHDTWLHRRYASGMLARASGLLQLGSRCLAGGGFAPCTEAPVWKLDGGSLTAGTGDCLEAQPTGELRLAACRRTPAQWFALDDEGHLWSGLPPAPEGDMAQARLRCVVDDGGAPRAVLCRTAPAWWMVRRITTTARTATGLARGGRAVQLGDAGLCEIAGGRLTCARLQDDGVLQPAQPIAALDVEPDSLALGDVDGDGRTDACGRDAGGVTCARSASGLRATRFTTLFPATASDRALWIVAGRACIAGRTGLACAAVGATAPDTRTVEAPAWAGDLDGDREPDACGPGPRCATRAQATAAWGSAQGGAVEAQAASGLAVLTDEDGDGRADLCAVEGGYILCARSLGYGFAPRRPVAAAGLASTELWAHGARMCAADATQIACTR